MCSLHVDTLFFNRQTHRYDINLLVIHMLEEQICLRSVIII